MNPSTGILLLGAGVLGMAALLSGNLDRILERLAGAPPASSAAGKVGRPLEKQAGATGEAATGVGTGSAAAGSLVAREAHRAGFRGEALVMALAIARGESGWRPDAVGDVAISGGQWGPSIGLFQVRCLRAETGTGKPRDCAALYDPTFNARAAFSISAGGTNWQPWTVYTTGAYSAHLAAARQAIAAAGLA